MALSSAAAPHRTAVYLILFAFFGIFGGCIPLVREGREGWIEKLLLAGYPERAWWAERTAAHACLDAAQLLPAVGLLILLEEASVGSLLALGPALLLALAVANLLGGLIAATVRSLAEGALACAAVGLGVLHLTGVFRPAPPGSVWHALESASFFRPLFKTLALVTESAPAIEPVSAGPLLSGFAFLLAGWILAPAIERRLGASL